MNVFITPFVSGLVGLYLWLGNLGWSVVLMTVLIRLVLLPLVWPSLKSATKMQRLQPKLKRLKEKYKDNKEGLAKAQMDLYKNEGINPLSGCLPQLLQVAVLIMFFSAFRTVSGVAMDGKGVEELNNSLVVVSKLEEGFVFGTEFLGGDLIKTPAMVFKGEGGGNSWLPMVLLLGSAVMQFLGAKMMAPSPKVDEAVVKKTEDKEDDMAVAMRNQSTYMMPLMTVFLGWNFSVGILLYWFVNSAMMMGQQVLVGRLKK